MNTTTKKTIRKIIYLRFPADSAKKSIIYTLSRRFDLTFNILQASITPRREGRMTLELSGTQQHYTQGIDYLSQQGITAQPVAQKISRDEDKCFDCGLCTAMCPTDALHVDKKTRAIGFDSEACTACGLCTRICPVDAMDVEMDW